MKSTTQPNPFLIVLVPASKPTRSEVLASKSYDFRAIFKAGSHRYTERCARASVFGIGAQSGAPLASCSLGAPKKFRRHGEPERGEEQGDERA